MPGPSGFDDPLGGLELPFDGSNIWNRGSGSGGSNNGSGNSDGSGCLKPILIVAAIIGLLVFFGEVIYFWFT